MSQPARVLAAADIRFLLRYVRTNRHACRDEAMIILSFKSGLRTCEIAGLDWSMVLKPQSGVDRQIYLAGRITKIGAGLRVCVNPVLRAALVRLHSQQDRPQAGRVILSERGDHLRPRNVVSWCRATYAELGMPGCPSHSGKRTFITRAARLLAHMGGSPRDGQQLAGDRAWSLALVPRRQLTLHHAALSGIACAKTEVMRDIAFFWTPAIGDGKDHADIGGVNFLFGRDTNGPSESALAQTRPQGCSAGDLGLGPVRPQFLWNACAIQAGRIARPARRQEQTQSNHHGHLA